MTNKFTFETTDAVLASAIFDLINGKPAAKAKPDTREKNAVREIPGEKSVLVDVPVAASPTPTPVVQEPSPVAAAAEPTVQTTAPVAEVLATPASEPPVTSDQLMKVLSDFLAKFGHDAAKEVFAKHQAPPSISALVAESADKARAVFNDFSAQLNA